MRQERTHRIFDDSKWTTVSAPHTYNDSDSYDEIIVPQPRIGYEWTGRAFNPNYGGLNHNIWLHLTGKVYQTLPLYENLQTTGVYVYPTNFSIKDGTCDVNVEAQVKNDAEQQVITLTGVVVDAAKQIA